jgi:hypothetical protein
MALRAWMQRNLATQGYCLTAAEERELAVGLRFSTGLCLALVVTALALQSAAMLLALVAVGAVAGFSARHPFDHVWNAVAATPLPPNPSRRRDAFKVATVWLACTAVLFLAGAATAALVLGALLVGACAVVTATNFCIPSESLAYWERRNERTRTVTP